MKYKNKQGTFTLKGGVLSDKDGNRVAAMDVTTNRDPLKRVKEKGAK